ncbi:MAG: methionyl-tRNA formyltransferase [Acidobacteria bacterium]|nr:methionyl-tRNA formyltransferase [Acidobacteriota bacterium]
MGTAEFAVPSLYKLADSVEHQISAVITQPDAKAGRGQKMQATPVKQAALEKNLLVIEAGKIGTSQFRSTLRNLEADIIYCCAYGKFLTEKILKLTPYGAVNLHPSLLPKYRGAAPVQHSLINGEKKTAITFFRMVREMDAGDILYQEIIDIKPEETAGKLLKRTAELGAERLPSLLSKIEKSEVNPIQQDHKQATFAPPLIKENGRINWNDPAEKIFNLWRGLTPKPGIFTFLDSNRVKICSIGKEFSANIKGLKPGELRTTDSRLFIGTGESGVLEILELQFEGKKSCPAFDFINGYKADGHFFNG